MTRMLFIAASAQLMAGLSEQFEALGGYCARAMAPDGEPPEARPCDAAIIDADFCDAPALARRLRAGGFAGMIVTLGAASDDADACLTRPLRVPDLLALLERPHPSPGVSFGVRLTEKEEAILTRLSQAQGAAIPKASLLADVWGYGPNVTTRTLETHIHRLRRKIEADPHRPQKLLTDGDGYRLAKSTTKR